jgi:S-adenosylmethionine decarboxylase
VVSAAAAQAVIAVHRATNKMSPNTVNMTPAFSPQGTHVLADFWGVATAKLTDLQWIEAALRIAAKEARANILSCQLHQFAPDAAALRGVTGVLLLAESHISIHTWPEHGMAAIDIYLCGSSDAKTALVCLIGQFTPTRQVVHTQLRGLT